MNWTRCNITFHAKATANNTGHMVPSNLEHDKLIQFWKFSINTDPEPSIKHMLPDIYISQMGDCYYFVVYNASLVLKACLDLI